MIKTRNKSMELNDYYYYLHYDLALIVIVLMVPHTN